jgi:hypothetical protein
VEYNQRRIFSKYGLHTFLAVDEIVVVLHADELVPTVLLGDVLESLELPCSHLLNVSLLVKSFVFPGISTYTASANISDLTTLDDIV